MKFSTIKKKGIKKKEPKKEEYLQLKTHNQAFYDPKLDFKINFFFPH